MTKINRDVSGLTRNVFVGVTSMLAMMFVWLPEANAAVACNGRTVVANVVVIDQPIMYNRLGASNINGMIYALEHDVINLNANADPALNLPPLWRLRPDKRPRPLVLRVREGDCLTINLENRLQAIVNPNAPPINIPPLFNTLINDQVADRHVSMHVNGLQYVNGPNQDDGAFVGNNDNSTIPLGGNTTYHLYAIEEGAFAVRGMATTVGADANQGNSANLLLGEVIVEPANSAIYRSQVTEEEMRLASMDLDSASPTCGLQKTSANGHPIINYEARYPATALTCIAQDGTGTETIVDLGQDAWIAEGKAGLPILNMIDTATNEIKHSEINAFVGYGVSGALEPAPNGPYAGRLGHFPKETYPLESVNKRNPSVPNRLEPFRDFASIFHDEPSTKQAFPGFYEPAAAGGNDVFRYVLAGVKDGFMINYGSGGIGSEIIANRLGVGPMHDCLTCAYEEFFFNVLHSQ